MYTKGVYQSTSCSRGFGVVNRRSKSTVRGSNLARASSASSSSKLHL